MINHNLRSAVLFCFLPLGPQQSDTVSLVSFFFLPGFQEQIVQPVAMESCPQKANRVTVNTQHWVHHLHLPPPLPLHLWTTRSPIPQILPNLSSTVVRVIKKPGIVFLLETPEGGWHAENSLSLLSKEPEGHLSFPFEKYCYLQYLPSTHKPVLAPLPWLTLGGSSHREYYDALFLGTKLSHYTDAFGSQCGSLPRSFPSQPGVVSAEQFSCPVLCEAAAQATMAWCIALLCNFLGLPVALFLPGEPLSQQ